MASRLPFRVRARLRSFRYALRGTRHLLISQHNARIHAAFSAGVISAGFYLRLGRLEWCAIIIAMMAVWTAEALNTALEFLCDAASPDIHPLIEKSKDIAAAGVLISALGSAVVGVLIFGPHIFGKL
jgi:diacylglycerol kinase